MAEELNIQSDAETIDDKEDSLNIERCLTFESGGLLMYMSTKYVNEIINEQIITALPMVPPHIKGIINLRGSILPVLDICMLMGKESAEYTNKTCIIVLNIGSDSVGIIVDKVRQVIDIDLSVAQSIPLRNQQKLTNGMLTLDTNEVAMSLDVNSLIPTQMM